MFKKLDVLLIDGPELYISCECGGERPESALLGLTA